MDFLPLLISAIITVESGNDPGAAGDNGKSVGILQIQKCVVEDVNRIYHKEYKWPESVQDKNEAVYICGLYLIYWGNRYENKAGRRATPEILSKIWVAGPDGYTQPESEPYWQKVKSVLNNK